MASDAMSMTQGRNKTNRHSQRLQAAVASQLASPRSASVWTQGRPRPTALSQSIPGKSTHNHRDQNTLRLIKQNASLSPCCERSLTFLILESSVTACLFPGSRSKTVSKSKVRICKELNHVMEGKMYQVSSSETSREGDKA